MLAILPGMQVVDAGAEEYTLAWWVWPLLLASFWLMMAWTVQRLHDIGWTGFLAPLTIAPVVGFLFTIALFLIPGQPGLNRYGGRNGEPPRSRIRNQYGAFPHHHRPPPEPAAPGQYGVSADGLDLQIVEYDAAAELRRLRAGDGNGGL